MSMERISYLLVTDPRQEEQQVCVDGTRAYQTLSRLIVQPPGTFGESNAIAFSVILGGDIPMLICILKVKLYSSF